MIPNLMVVDDNAVDQKLYHRIATRSGLVGSIHSFTDAEAALAFLRRTLPERPMIDAILLDINMPGMSGFDFLDAAADTLGDGIAHPVVIMLSTSMSDTDRNRADSHDLVKGYILKPLTVDTLHEVISLLGPRGAP